jgi:hypothetical protein
LFADVAVHDAGGIDRPRIARLVAEIRNVVPLCDTHLIRLHIEET